MSDGDIAYKFFGDVSAAEKEFAKLEKRLDTQESKLKQVSRTSRQTSQQEQSAFQQTIAGAGQAALAYVSVGTAITAATGVISGYIRRVSEAAKANERFKGTLAADLLFTGDLPNQKDVLAFLEESRGVTREQSRASFTGVAGGAPALDPEIRKRLSRQVERLSPVLTTVDDEGKVQGVEKLQQFGAVVGRLAKLSRGAIKNAEDVADLALVLSAESGDVSSQLASPGAQKAIGSLRDRGVPFERALAIVAESLEETGSARGVATLAAKLSPGDGITLKSLQADPALARKVLGETAFADFEKLQAEDIDRRTKSFRDVFRRDLIGEQLQFASDLDPAKFVRQQAAAERDLQLRKEGDRESNLAAQAELNLARESQFVQSIPGAQWFLRQGLRVEDLATRGRGLLTGEDEAIDFQARSREIAIRSPLLGQPNGSTGELVSAGNQPGQRAVAIPAGNGASDEMLQKMLDGQDQQTRVLERVANAAETNANQQRPQRPVRRNANTEQ